MRALILSDIHANFEALNAVLEISQDGPRYDVLWNLGDTVGYGGSPNQVIERIRPLTALTVRGNHDRVCCGLSSALNFNPVARAAVEWTKSELTAENLTWLRELHQGPLHPRRVPTAVAVPATPSAAALAPAPISAAVPGGVLLAAGSASSGDPAAPFASDPDFDPAATTVACAHGSPIHEDHYILSLRDARAPLQQMSSPLTFIGHTHIQGGFNLHTARTERSVLSSRQPPIGDDDWQEFRPRFFSRSRAETWVRRLQPGDRHLINPGSVGQPRDGDWRAAFAIYDDVAAEITFFRVPYDVTAAQGRILMAGLPERLAGRLREGR